MGVKPSMGPFRRLVNAYDKRIWFLHLHRCICNSQELSSKHTLRNSMLVVVDRPIKKHKMETIFSYKVMKVFTLILNNDAPKKMKTISNVNRIKRLIKFAI